MSFALPLLSAPRSLAAQLCLDSSRWKPRAYDNLRKKNHLSLSRSFVAQRRERTMDANELVLSILRSHFVAFLYFSRAAALLLPFS